MLCFSPSAEKQDGTMATLRPTQSPKHSRDRSALCLSLCIVQSRSKLRYSLSRSLTDGSVKSSKQLEVMVGIQSASLSAWTEQILSVIFQLCVKRAIFFQKKPDSSFRTNSEATDLNYWMRSVTCPTWVPSANTEGLMSCTAANHQGASRSF